MNRRGIVHSGNRERAISTWIALHLSSLESGTGEEDGGGGRKWKEGKKIEKRRVQDPQRIGAEGERERHSLNTCSLSLPSPLHLSILHPIPTKHLPSWSIWRGDEECEGGEGTVFGWWILKCDGALWILHEDIDFWSWLIDHSQAFLFSLSLSEIVLINRYCIALYVYKKSIIPFSYRNSNRSSRSGATDRPREGVVGGGRGDGGEQHAQHDAQVLRLRHLQAQ